MPSALATLLLLVAMTASAQTAQDSASLNGLPLDGTVTGTVTNDEGEPIQGASVCTEISYGRSSSTSCGPTETDSRGQFSIRVPLGEIGVYAENQNAGYWRVVEASPSRRKEIHKVKLTRDAPTATVNLDLGPRPGLLKFNVKDKTTGKPIEAFTTRWIGMDEPLMWSLHGPATQTPIPAGIDVILTIHAKGYRRWFYLDPSTSQPTIRLASGEVRELAVELEPEENK